MISYLSLFSGMGAPEKALENLGIDYNLIAYSEIDKYASKAYSLIHHIPESKNLGDITKINEYSLPKDIDLLTYGFPCLVGDTLVLTSDGFKQIKDITVGDSVLTHDGTYQKVTNSLCTGIKPTYELIGIGTGKIRCTGNHLFYVKKVDTEPEWVACENLNGDYYLCMPTYFLPGERKDAYAWIPIYTVSPTHELEPVYDITVEKNHSFTANGVIVHNCTDISIAGEKKGFIDADGNKTHSGLFFDALRIIATVQPKIAIAENVKNLTSKSFSSTFKLILDSLNEVGYTNYWKVLNAADYGIAQSRERVFIVSIRNDIDLDMDFNFPDGKILTTCLKDYLQSNVPKSFYLSEDQTNSAIMYSKYEGDMKIIQIADLKHYNNDQMNRIYSPEGLCPTLKTVSGGGREIKIMENGHYRKLTPLEYFRLMGFTDEDYQVCVNDGISKTQLYKMAGNSICVPVLEAIFNQLYDKQEE